MDRYRTAATIETQGELHLSELPFRTGDEVCVTVVKRQADQLSLKGRYPLRGQVVRFERPFDSVDSVAGKDWEALS